MLTAEKELLENDARAGTIRIVFRNVLSFGERSFRAGEAAACAGRQGRFWEMHEILFQEQATTWGTADTAEALSAQMRRFAEKIEGLDRGAFASCLGERTTLAALRANDAEQRTRGITSQPIFEVFPEGARLAGAQAVGVYRDALVRKTSSG